MKLKEKFEKCRIENLFSTQLVAIPAACPYKITREKKQAADPDRPLLI